MVRIKKFAGPNIAESLSLAKREMGEDALILQTIRRRKGAAQVVEIVAANSAAAETAANLAAAGSPAGSGPGPSSEPPAGRVHTSGTEVLRNIDLSIVHELEQVEMQLNSIMTRIAPPTVDGRRRELSELRVNLQNAGFDSGLVQKRILKVEPVPGSSFRAYLREFIDDVPLEVPEEKISIFMGPSGAGKTTALLKVASSVLMARDMKPRVIHFGSVRAGDSRELASRCKELGLSFKRVSDRRRLLREIAKRGGSPVLVDTPGIADLGDGDTGFLTGLAGSAGDAVVRLVVNSAMDPANISAIASCLPHGTRVSLVLTKLDEASRIGGAISAAIKEDIPVSYLTGGRDIHSGILVPDRSLIYERVLEGLGEMAAVSN